MFISVASLMQPLTLITLLGWPPRSGPQKSASVGAAPGLYRLVLDGHNSRRCAFRATSSRSAVALAPLGLIVTITLATPVPLLW